MFLQHFTASVGFCLLELIMICIILSVRSAEIAKLHRMHLLYEAFGRLTMLMKAERKTRTIVKTPTRVLLSLDWTIRLDRVCRGIEKNCQQKDKQSFTTLWNICLQYRLHQNPVEKNSIHYSGYVHCKTVILQIFFSKM